ncbi:hypothetical protein Q7P36_001537 [Cladosporium allicinum]
MSLDGEPSGGRGITSFQTFYDSPTFSDVKIFLPTSCSVIYAHRKDRVVEFRADEEDGTAAMMAAIRHNYGFDLPGTSLYNLAWIGAVAEKYEIAGLSELALETARRALIDCLSDEEKLKEFLDSGDIWTDPVPRYTLPFAFVVRILGRDLTAIRTKAGFQKFLTTAPKLALDLLNLVAEEKDELEETLQKMTEDSK